MERTLILAKPDAVQRGLVGEIISRFEQRGLKLVGMKLVQMEEELAGRHYAVHQGKPFYEGLIEFITSAPVVAMAWEGAGAIDAARSTMGVTDPVKAGPGTIRGDYGIEIGRNLVHGSDSAENAAKEVALFFEESELLDWERGADRWTRE